MVQLRATTKGNLKPKAVALSEQKVSISHFRSRDRTCLPAFRRQVLSALAAWSLWCLEDRHSGTDT